MAESLEELDAWTPQHFLKWPNDLYWQDPRTLQLKKVGGILCEIHQKILRVGWGVNLTGTPDFDQATSVAASSRSTITPEQLLKILRPRFEAQLASWVSTPEIRSEDIVESLNEQWMRKFFEFEGKLSDGTEARPLRLLANGHLEVQNSDGDHREVVAGEFVLNQ
jgi:biotin-(acetyl-CoA carboxylase) ligase